jgi:hypothetical protein
MQVEQYLKRVSQNVSQCNGASGVSASDCVQNKNLVMQKKRRGEFVRAQNLISRPTSSLYLIPSLLRMTETTPTPPVCVNCKPTTKATPETPENACKKEYEAIDVCMKKEAGSISKCRQEWVKVLRRVEGALTQLYTSRKGLVRIFLSPLPQCWNEGTVNQLSGNLKMITTLRRKALVVQSQHDRDLAQ